MAKASTKRVTEKASVIPPFYKKNTLHFIVVVFSLLLFSNSLFNKYNMDDELVTREHRLTAKGISAIPEIFTSPYYQDDMGYAYDYRPIPLTTFAIEHSMFGDNPLASHFINWILYAFLCLCLFRLLVSIGGAITPMVGLFITLLFCAHPSHTEVVCSIKNREEILGLLFCVLAVHTALSAARKTSWWRLFSVAAFFLLALLCKPTFVAFAFFIPLAVVLFTETAFLFTLTLTALLSIEAYSILDIGAGNYKLWLVLLLIAGITTIHFMVKGIPVNRIGSFFKNDKTATPGSPFSGLKSWYSEFRLSSFYSLLPTAIILLIYVYCCRNTQWLALLLCVIVFGSAYLNYKKFEYWSLSLGFLLAIVLINIEPSSLIHSTDSNTQVVIFYVLLFFFIFWGKHIVRLPALFLLAVIIYYLGKTRGDISELILTIPLLAFSRMINGRKLLTAALFVLAFWLAINVFGAIKSASISFISIALVLKIALVLFLLNRGKVWPYFIKKRNTILALITLVVCFLFPWKLQNTASNLLFSNKDYLNVVKTVVKTKTERPLNYVEFPLPQGTSNDLRIGTSLMVLGHYLGKTLFPYPLSFYYGYAYIKPTAFKEIVPLIVLAIHLLLLLATLFLLRKNKYISFALIVYLLSVLQFSGYFIFVPGIVADRYLLVPSIGWSIILTLIFFKLWEMPTMPTNTKPYSMGAITYLPKGIKYGLGGILCIYSIATFARNFDWKDDLTLMRHDIINVEQSAQAHNLLALHLMQYQGKEQNLSEKTKMIEEALFHFKKAKEIYPQFFNVTFDIGRVYYSLNMPDSALISFEQALTIDTGFSDLYFDIADINVSKGNFEKAIPYLNRFVQLRPKEFKGYDKLSFTYFKMNEFEKSIEVNKQLIRVLPDYVDPLVNIGNTYVMLNQTDSARFYFQQALIKTPNNPGILNRLKQIDKK